MSCSIIKKIDKNKTETKSESEIDSSANVKKDVTKETKVTSVITEKADTLIDIEGFEHSKTSSDLHNNPIVISDNGFTAIVTDSAGVTKLKVKLEDKQIPVKINKTTKVVAETKEEDKTKSKVDLRKEDKEEAKVKGVSKDIKKTGFPWWLWLLLILVTLGYLVKKYYPSIKKFFV